MRASQPENNRQTQKSELGQTELLWELETSCVAMSNDREWAVFTRHRFIKSDFANDTVKTNPLMNHIFPHPNCPNKRQRIKLLFSFILPKSRNTHKLFPRTRSTGRLSSSSTEKGMYEYHWAKCTYDRVPCRSLVSLLCVHFCSAVLSVFVAPSFSDLVTAVHVRVFIVALVLILLSFAFS